MIADASVGVLLNGGAGDRSVSAIFRTFRRDRLDAFDDCLGLVVRLRQEAFLGRDHADGPSSSTQSRMMRSAAHSARRLSRQTSASASSRLISSTLSRTVCYIVCQA